MWWFPQVEKPKCAHSYKKLGLFFLDYKTRYSNEFDEISICEHSKCEICGKDNYEYLYTEKFPPSLYRSSCEKDILIEKLKKKGIPSKMDYALNTFLKERR